MASQLLLDPSILMTRRGLESVSSLWANRRPVDVWIPESFAITIHDGNANDLEQLYRFFGRRKTSPSRDMLTEFLLLTQNHQWKVSEKDRDILPEFKAVLYSQAKNRLVADILFEEWMFLRTQSWIASRTKRVFKAFIRAGAASVELGRQGLEKVVARTLKISTEEPPPILTKGRVLKTATKWIAVGGLGVVTQLKGLELALGSAAVGSFFLLDP